MEYIAIIIGVLFLIQCFGGFIIWACYELYDAWCRMNKQYEQQRRRERRELAKKLKKERKHE